MAFSENGTKLTNLVNPEVLADMVNAKLPYAMRYVGLAEVDNTLVGVPGDTLTMPAYEYIGDATDVGEGADIPITKMTTTKASVKVKKAGKGVEISDEAVLSGYGDPFGQAATQIAMSIGAKVDKDMLGTLTTVAAGMTHTCTSDLSADEIADALVLFGEEIEGEKVLIVGANDYAILRKADDWAPASDIAAELIIRGTVGMVHGCQVVVSDRLNGRGLAFIVKPGALKLVMKRGAQVETDRNIIAKSTIITGDEHYATYLYDSSKAIKIITGDVSA